MIEPRYKLLRQFQVGKWLFNQKLEVYIGMEYLDTRIQIDFTPAEIKTSITSNINNEMEWINDAPDKHILSYAKLHPIAPATTDMHTHVHTQQQQHGYLQAIPDQANRANTVLEIQL